MDLLKFITKDNIEVFVLLKIPLTNDLNSFLLRFSTTTNESEAVGSSSPTRALGFFSPIDKLSVIKLQSRWERDDIVSMSGVKNWRSVYLLSESNRFCMSEIFDLRDMCFVMMWMNANLIRVEFRSQDDEWNWRNIVYVHNLFITNL